jgi:ubiquinone/menaquinone biosynthesis C-methylase UbiE
MRELFAGTADRYRQYRPPYPTEVFDWIAAQQELDGTGKLLDCGCGTGGVFVGLARWFSHTVAVDPDDAMLAGAQLTAAENRIKAITFLHGRAEDLPDTVAPLRMAAFGASFHWTDRISVARRLDRLIEPGGAIVILSPSSLWTSRVHDWKRIVLDTIKRWLGEQRRAGPGLYSARPLHAECLKDTPFRTLAQATFVQPYVWTADSIVRYLFSTSFASRAVLGEKAERFEVDLRTQLSRLSPSGYFEDEIEHSVISAKRP